LSTVDTIPTAANEPNKANLKTNVLNQEIALPCRESGRYISSQLNKGKNQFCISIKVDLDTGKIISTKLTSFRGSCTNQHARTSPCPLRIHSYRRKRCQKILM